MAFFQLGVLFLENNEFIGEFHFVDFVIDELVLLIRVFDDGLAKSGLISLEKFIHLLADDDWVGFCVLKCLQLQESSFKA